MRLSSDSWFLLAAVAAAIGIAPLVVRGNSSTNARRQQAREQLALMTPAERQQLDQNFAQFKQMPPDRQKEWLEFHRQLETDVQEGGQALNALEGYSQWVTSLSAFHADELHRETDPTQRVELIKSIEKERDENRFQWGGLGGRFKNPRWWSALSNDDFWRVMNVLEGDVLTSAASGLTSNEREAIAKAEPDTSAHALELLAALGKHGQTFASLATDDLIRRMVAEIQDPEARRQIEFPRSFRNAGGDDRNRMAEPRLGLQRNLSLKLLGLLSIDGMRSPPTDESLINAMKAKPAGEREWLYHLAADELKSFVRNDYFWRRRGDDRRIVGEFFDYDAFPQPGGKSGNQRGERKRNGDETDAGKERKKD